MPPLPDRPSLTSGTSSADSGVAPHRTLAGQERQGRRGAAVALGALALTTGITAAIDVSTRSATPFSVGRLAISSTGHKGSNLTPAQATPTAAGPTSVQLHPVIFRPPVQFRRAT